MPARKLQLCHRCTAGLTRGLRVLLPGLALLLSACGSDSGESTTGSNPSPQPSVGSSETSLFADSTIADERFATILERESDPLVAAAVLDTTTAGLNEFSLDVHRRLAEESPTENAISSGYSLATAITLLRAGAADVADNSLANLTRLADIDETELHRAMNAIALTLESRSSEDVLLRTANRLFSHPQRLLDDAFLDTAVGQYGAPGTVIDFRVDNADALALINGWVAEQTDNLIPMLLTELSPDTQAMIVNAVLLDALWQFPFEPRGDRPFRLLDGSTLDVENFGDTRSLSAFSDETLTAVELPYKGGELAMLLIQPETLESFETSFDQTSLTAIRASLDLQTVDLTMPTWRVETRFVPQRLLAAEGFPASPLPLDDLFADDPLGELYELTTVHQAVIEVDEFGTRAAAATAIGAGATSVPDVDLTITIDRPFVYVLLDRVSGLVLFAGRTVAP